MVTHYFKKHLDIKNRKISAGLGRQLFLKSFISLLSNPESIHLKAAVFQMLSGTVHVMHIVDK